MSADNQLMGYIDGTGTPVIAPSFVWAEDFTSNGLAAVQDNETNLYGYIDRTGAYVIPPQFTAGESFT